MHTLTVVGNLIKEVTINLLSFHYRRANILRQNRAAVQVQRYMKGWYYHNKYVKTRRSVLGIQRFGRGYLARQKFAVAMDTYRAVEIQRFCRGYLARKRYNEKIENIVKIQACVRRFLAKRQFKKLKAEARIISHLQTKYKGLENKIIELQQKCDVSNKENLVLKAQIAIIPDLRLISSSQNEIFY